MGRVESSRGRVVESQNGNAMTSSGYSTLDSQTSRPSYRGRLNKSGSGVATSSGASLIVGLGADPSSPSALAFAATRSYARPDCGRASTSKRLASAPSALACCKRLNDVRVRAAERDDRANHFVDARRNNALLRLALGREVADRDLVALHAVDQDRFARIEHQRQLELLILAEQHDFRQVALRDMHHIRPRHIQHVVMELPPRDFRRARTDRVRSSPTTRGTRRSEFRHSSLPATSGAHRRRSHRPSRSARPAR